MIQGWKRLKWQKKKTFQLQKKIGCLVWSFWFGGLNSAAPGMNIFNNIFIHSCVWKWRKVKVWSF